MSLKIVCDNGKEDMEVKTWGDGKVVIHVKNQMVAVEMEHFIAAMEYVLTNTDLEKRDPRLKFVREVAQLQKVKGWMPRRKRLGSPKK